MNNLQKKNNNNDHPITTNEIVNILNNNIRQLHIYSIASLNNMTFNQ